LELWSSVAQTVGLHDVLTVGQKRLEFNEGTGLAQAEGRRGRDITRTTSARIATGRSPGRGLMVMASSTFHFRLPWERRRLRAGLGRNTCLHSVSPCSYLGRRLLNMIVSLTALQHTFLFSRAFHSAFPKLDMKAIPVPLPFPNARRTTSNILIQKSIMKRKSWQYRPTSYRSQNPRHLNDTRTNTNCRSLLIG